MKYSFTFFTLLVLLKLNAQSSIELSDYSTNTLVGSNSSIFLTTSSNITVNYTVDVKNTSNVTKKYWIKRYDLVLNSGALAYFCFASYCYGPPTVYSPNPITLTPGQSASQLGITNFQMLVMDLTEGPNPAHSQIKYTVFDSINPMDSVQFSMIYNNGVGLKEVQNSLTSLSVYPNPSSGDAVLEFQSELPFSSKLQLFNALGELKSEKELSLHQGENKIKLDLNGFAAGLYYVSIRYGNSGISRKLILR